MLLHHAIGRRDYYIWLRAVSTDFVLMPCLYEQECFYTRAVDEVQFNSLAQRLHMYMITLYNSIVKYSEASS